MLGAADAGTITKRSASIDSAGNKCTRSQGVKEMGGTVAENYKVNGGAEVNPKLWDVNDVAEFLQLAVGSVYQLLSQKRLPCIRISARCVRFDPRQIEAWVAERTEKPKAK